METNELPQLQKTDDEMAVEIMNHYSRGRALRPPMFQDKTVISVKLSKRAKERLQYLASQLGYVHSGHGNISMLLEAIGTDTVEVTITPKLR